MNASCVQVQCGTCGAIVSAKQGEACPACDCFPKFHADIKANAADPNVREFSILLTARVDGDHPETLAWLKEGLHDAVLMIPNVVDMHLDTIVEVTESRPFAEMAVVSR